MTGAISRDRLHQTDRSAKDSRNHERRQYASVDLAKLLFAVLVVAVHTDPLISFSPIANYLLVSVLARLAVPFFFLTSGYFLAEKLNANTARGQSRRIIKQYLARMSVLYLAWTVIYLPYACYLWVTEHHFAAGYWSGFLQRFLFQGSYYTLWFLPALLLAVPLALLLQQRMSQWPALLLCCGLYLVGTLGQSYFDLLPDSQVLGHLLAAYDLVFCTTRNGLFFGLPFVWLGFSLSRQPPRLGQRASRVLFLVSLLALTIEALALRSLPFTRGNGMWLSLLPATAFCFLTVRRLKVPSRPLYRTVRSLSTLLYLSHGLVIIGYSGVVAKVVPEQSLLRFLCVLIGSLILSGALLWAAKRYPLLKVLV